MPAQILPTIAGMDEFRILIERAGFTKIRASELYQLIQRYGLESPRPTEGREMGFRYHWSGLTVYVWTSWMEKELRAKKKDSGWVLIIQDGKRAYVHRLNRTKNFLHKLYRYAVIARQRILKRPVCFEHKVFMRIFFGKGIKSRYWKCDFGEHMFPKLAVKSFDFGLTKEMKEFLEIERKDRARGREKSRAEGKEPGAAIRKRKSWIVRNPPIEVFR